MYIWNYSPTSCGRVISTMIELALNLFAVFFIISMDTFIFFKFRRMNKALRKSGACPISVTEQQQRRKRENRFFVQACCSESLYLFAFTCFYGSTLLPYSKWGLFGLTTMIWELFHTFDGEGARAFFKQFGNALLGKQNKELNQTEEESTMNPLSEESDTVSMPIDSSSVIDGDEPPSQVNQAKATTNHEDGQNDEDRFETSIDEPVKAFRRRILKLYFEFIKLHIC
ncbi:unnamed protein product [Anisakis simplex]|uniref:7TM_GPCR_Srx domain-containing protein n=1 Tax=Anisakis simplex TaxID=6269 RepID=A0A0M3J0F0_ANISI|nr:unnamed protein product [Anisakis simplex]